MFEVFTSVWTKAGLHISVCDRTLVCFLSYHNTTTPLCGVLSEIVKEKGSARLFETQVRFIWCLVSCTYAHTQCQKLCWITLEGVLNWLFLGEGAPWEVCVINVDTMKPHLVMKSMTHTCITDRISMISTYFVRLHFITVFFSSVSLCVTEVSDAPIRIAWPQLINLLWVSHYICNNWEVKPEYIIFRASQPLVTICCRSNWFIVFHGRKKILRVCWICFNYKFASKRIVSWYFWSWMHPVWAVLCPRCLYSPWAAGE